MINDDVSSFPCSRKTRGQYELYNYETLVQEHTLRSCKSESRWVAPKPTAEAKNHSGRGLSQQLVLHPQRRSHRAVSHEGSLQSSGGQTWHHWDGSQESWQKWRKKTWDFLDAPNLLRTSRSPKLEVVLFAPNQNEYFSRMRSEGSRFTLGVWGWGCVRQKLRLRPQAFATVGNRRQPSAWVP